MESIVLSGIDTNTYALLSSLVSTFDEKEKVRLLLSNDVLEVDAVIVIIYEKKKSSLRLLRGQLISHFAKILIFKESK
jgi:hypothetical protein